MSAPTTDPRTIRAHERHACSFCVALQRLAVRRCDLGLIAAAERLGAEHLAADAERTPFSAPGRRTSHFERVIRDGTR